MAEKVKFIRVNGRVIPIRDRGNGSGKDGSDGRNRVAGAAGVAGGAVAIKKAAPLVTGRTILYHGTTASNAQKIMAEGLKRNGSTGIGDMFEGSFDAKNYTYMTPSRSQAGTYAGQAAGLEKFIDRTRFKERVFRRKTQSVPSIVKEYSLAPQRVIDHVLGGIGLSKGKVTKASIPLWKKGGFPNRVPNPELGGAKNGAEFARVLSKRTGMSIGPKMAERTFKGLNTPTFDGDIPANYFKGSKSYTKLSLSEVKSYAKLHKSRFATGVGLGVAGALGIGLGVRALFGRSKKDEK